MKYVIYLRVSTKKQDERPQLEHCLNFLRSRDKSEFNYVVYTDSISSRKKIEKREGLQSALSFLKAGDILVGMRLDRLARNLYETTCIIHELEKKRSEIVLVDQPGIKNKVLLGLYAGMAEEEVKLIRKRIKEKMFDKRVRNERINYEPPYGYKIHETELVNVKTKDGRGWVMKPGKLVQDDREQEALKLMVEMSSAGISYHKIGVKLEELGYTNRKGNQFQPMSICRILNRINPSKHEDRSQEESKFALFH